MIVSIGGDRVSVQVFSSGLARSTESAALDAVLAALLAADLTVPGAGVIWAHNYDRDDGDGAMWRRAIAAGIAANKPVKGFPGSYVLDGAPYDANGLIGLSGAGKVHIECDTGEIVFSAPASTSRALLTLTNGADAYFHNVVWDATNVTSNFAIKRENAGDFGFGLMEVKYKGFRNLGTNGDFSGDTLKVTSIQGHGCSAGSATGEAFGYANSGRVKWIVATDVTGSGFNWSATKVLGHLRIENLICRWTKWPDGEAYPTRYAALRLGNGTSNISVGYVYAEGVYRGVRLTDTDNCWVDHFDFRNLIGPAILFNRKDQRAINSGVLKVTGVGPCRGNRRNDIGVSDKDSELIAGEGDRAGVIQEGKWTLGQMTISGDENSTGSGIITASTASATVTNKDSDYVGQDFNCFDDVVVGDLLFTTAGVVLGKVLSKGSKTYWTDAGGTISQPSAAGANHATQSLTLTGLSAATVTAVAYEQRTPDDYFYVANTGNITISGANITNNSLTAATGTITCSTSSATVTGVGTDFDGEAAIGKSLFRASDDAFIGQIADIDETLPNTVLTLTDEAAITLGSATTFKVGYSFVTQFEPGDLIFDSSLNFAGVVNTVPTPLTATLTASTLAPAVTNAGFRYGKLYKCAVGLEVAESATDTNVNLDDVLVLGATTQHDVAQPNCIKPTLAQTITKDQLATLDATKLIGVRHYVSNIIPAGYVKSNGVVWVKEDAHGLVSRGDVAGFTHTYIDSAPSTRLSGAITTNQDITLSDTGLPAGARYEFIHAGTGSASWVIKNSGGTTLITLRPGETCWLVYDGSVPVWRLAGKTAGGFLDSAGYSTPQLALDAAYAMNRPCLIRGSTDVSINLAITSGQTAYERMTALSALVDYLQTCITAGTAKIWIVVPAGHWTLEGATATTGGNIFLSSPHCRIGIRGPASPSQLYFAAAPTFVRIGATDVFTMTITVDAAPANPFVVGMPIAIFNPVGDNSIEVATGAHIIDTVLSTTSFTCKVQFPMTDSGGAQVIPTDPTTYDVTATTDNSIRRCQVQVPRATFSVLGGFDGAVIEGWINVRGGARGEQKWLGVAYGGSATNGCLYLIRDKGSEWYFGDYDAIVGGPERVLRVFGDGAIRANRSGFGAGPTATAQIFSLAGRASAEVIRCSIGSAKTRLFEITDGSYASIQQCFLTGGIACVQAADGGRADFKTAKMSFSTRGAYASQGGEIYFDTGATIKGCTRSMDTLAGGFLYRVPVLTGNAIDMTADTIVNGGGWYSSNTRGLRPRAPITKTSLYTSVEGDDILANTSGGAFTINLPSVHVAGDTVRISDAAGSWGTNNLTVTALSGTIVGVGTSFAAKVSKSSYTFQSDGTDWVRRSNLSGPIPITAAAMAALTASQWAGQTFTVTDLGLKPVTFYCDGSAMKPMSRAEVAWANRAALAAYSGLEVFVTDLGTGGSLWRANGTRLIRTGPITLYAASAAAGLSTAITGAGAETKAPGFTSPVIPAGVLNTGDIVVPECFWVFTGAAGTRRPAIRYGTADDLTGLLVSQASAYAASALQSITGAKVSSDGTAAQSVVAPSPLVGGFGSSTAAAAVGAYDTNANAIYVVASCTMAGAADTGILTGMTVRII